jgi:hypothetical protein
MSGKPISHEGLPAGLAEMGGWHISEFTNDESGLTIRGHFNLSPFEQLSREQADFLLTFLRCRGVISSVEKELGISYPTVRSRLDALLKALGLQPTAEAPTNGRRDLSPEQKDILEKLDRGDLTPEEAKKAMKEAGK